MIGKNELTEVGKIKGLKIRGYMEKDYLQEIVLLSISRNTGNELVFKGGTCLYKFYNLDRFSEDLDFSMINAPDADLLADKIVSDLNFFGINAKVSERKKIFNSILISISAQGPLYSGRGQSACRLTIDINLKSDVLYSDVKTFRSLYPDIPSFTLLVMREKEILAEKTRAVLARDAVKDVYDIYFLLNKGTELDLDLIEKKLEYYGIRWNPCDFENKIKKIRPLWSKELAPFIENPPGFEDAEEKILNKFKNLKI